MIISDYINRYAASLLERHRESPYLVRRKILVLFWTLVVGIVIFTLLLFVNLSFDPPYVDTAILNIILSLFLFVSLIFLYKGKYQESIIILVVSILVSWSIGFYISFPDFMETGKSIYYIYLYTILTTVAFFGTRRILNLVFLFFFLVNSLVFYLSLSRAAEGIFKTYILSKTINTYFALIIVYTMLNLISYITHTSLKKTEEELEKNRELAISLEEKVLSRTHELEDAYHEMEIINSALADSNNELIRAKSTMEKDMEMAINVQKAFLSGAGPNCLYWDISFHYRPMSGVSGDIYDFYLRDKELTGVSLFDVSGHGIASGLIAMVAKSIANNIYRKAAGKPLEKVMEDINRSIISEIGMLDNFLTGIILRVSGRKVEYVNAGHPSPLIKRSSGKTVENLGEGEILYGSLLGVSSLENRFSSIDFEVEKDDFIILYSDGLIEFSHLALQYHGADLLTEFIETIDNSLTAEEILQMIQSFYNSHIMENGQEDDLTIIVMKAL